MLASERGHTDVVKVLLEVPDIDVNAEDEVRKQLLVSSDVMIC